MARLAKKISRNPPINPPVRTPPTGKVMGGIAPKVPFGSTSKMPTYGQPVANPFGSNFGQKETRVAALPAKKSGVISKSIGALSKATQYPGSTALNGYVPPVGGGGGGGTSGGGGGVFDTTAGGEVVGDPAAAEAVAAPVEPPSVMSDPTFILMMSQLAQAKADKMNEDQLMRNQYGENFKDSLRMLGWSGDSATGSFDPNNQEGYYGQAYGDTTEDFAARGMLESGAYGGALQDLLTDYSKRKTGLDTANTQFLAGRDQDLANYGNQNTAALDQARLEAVARLAQEFQLRPDQIRLT